MLKKSSICLVALLLVSCDSPTSPSHGLVEPNPPNVILEPRGDVHLKVGESQIFTASGIIDGYEYSWSHLRPESNVGKYVKFENLSPNQVKVTALKVTRECSWVGFCFETPVHIWVYLTKDNVAYGRNNRADIYIKLF
ncbi:MAG: hypothetical protein Q8R55_02750 [Candidatus Taylorbacteria bacterium]|nr:hypothetical protein [Candidatus Taylorbacteria bacterium]